MEYQREGPGDRSGYFIVRDPKDGLRYMVNTDRFADEVQENLSTGVPKDWEASRAECLLGLTPDVDYLTLVQEEEQEYLVTLRTQVSATSAEDATWYVQQMLQRGLLGVPEGAFLTAQAVSPEHTRWVSPPSSDTLAQAERAHQAKGSRQELRALRRERQARASMAIQAVQASMT